jgi:hypothetical protein
VEGLRVMASPYRLSLQQFAQQVASVGDRLAAIIGDIEGTWKVELPYRFSDTLKGNIVLSENSLRAKSNDNGQLAVV